MNKNVMRYNLEYQGRCEAMNSLPLHYTIVPDISALRKKRPLLYMLRKLLYPSLHISIRTFILTKIQDDIQDSKTMTLPSVCETKHTSDGTRTRNPRLRRPMPYPLGHGGLKCYLLRNRGR